MTKDQGKHFLNDPTTLVSDSIRGLCYSQPHLRYLPQQNVVYDSKVRQIAKQQVTLVAGGGSGHEPAHAGFVGEGMLTAAVCGHVFASPSASQVLDALELIKSPFGTLVIIFNYTGDCLHFGLAVERAKARGIHIAMLVVGDDISVGRSKGHKVGRRGMAATALVIKVCGALASKGASLEQIVETGQYVIDHSATLGVALNHCHVPGTASNVAFLESFEMELGTGIHNEPGLTKMSLMEAQPLVERMVNMLLDQEDQDRAYLTYNNKEMTPVVLLTNNYGGTPSLEFNVIIKEAVEAISRRSSLCLKRILSGSFVTSLNMPGFSLSLLILDDDHLLELLDQPVQAIGWSSSSISCFSPSLHDDPATSLSLLDTGSHDTRIIDKSSDGTFIIKVIQMVIQALLKAEPTVTSYDTILGDGDCGYTLKSIAEAFEKELVNFPVSSIPDTLLALADTIDQAAGGTSSAIYCIFLSALANDLNKQMTQDQAPSLIMWAKACQQALDSLQVYTQARVGDRTMMDTLIPFVKTLNEPDTSLTKAIEAARQGMWATQTQTTQLGRTAYLSDQHVLDAGIPDAGAFGLMAVLDAIALALT
ncbi:dihydroxyacetone kinase [Halteromyces radiatus]|uniref:dihydroxyacetone kinase n=1 Tax=Halteromyces radiatus TaxID=101107 RepID=UPI00221E76DF|nr:dihydroxyacetone kinase [Halteromyces radiatus]KAI8077684.1 dihydroxyacetone kinase [Halteromyces radiatus]